MIDWTRLTRDPVDTGVRSKLKEWLIARRRSLPSNSYDAFLVDQINGKSVLDIGVCEHTAERINSPNWKHRLIHEKASRCVGVDIIKDLVEDLVTKGFDVRCEDATSDAFLGETFDIVHIGDVIEHVPNPQRLLEFGARHLNEGGRMIVRTPNPHNFDYQRGSRRQGISIENLEHVSYIVPFHAVELARRSNLVLTEYWTLSPGGLTLTGIRRTIGHVRGLHFHHAWNELFGEPNTYTTIFVYVFSKSS